MTKKTMVRPTTSILIKENTDTSTTTTITIIIVDVDDSEPPENLMCPITFELFKDLVVNKHEAEGVPRKM